MNYKVFFLLFLLILTSFCFGASRYAVANNSWNNTATWSASSGGASGASIPVAGDIVYIGEGTAARTVLIPAAYSAQCATMYFGSSTGNNVAATCQLANVTSSLIVSGNVTMYRPSGNTSKTITVAAGTVTINGNLGMSVQGNTGTNANRVNTITISTGTLTIGGNLTFNGLAAAQNSIVFSAAGALNIGGAFTLPNNLGTLTPSTGTVTFNGTAAQAIPIGVSSVTYYNLYFNNAGTKTISAAISATNVTGNVNVQGGNLSNGGFAIVGNAARTFTVANGAAYTLTGTTTMPTGFGTTTLGASSTVNYAGTSQTITNYTYGNLTTSESGTCTLGGGTIVNGTLTVTSGTLAVSTFSLVVNDSAVFNATNFVNGAGSFVLSSGATLQTANTDGIAASGATGSVRTTTRTFNSNATYIYNGSLAQVTGTGLPSPVTNLTIDNSAGVNLSGSTSVTGTLSLTTGLTIGSNVLTIGGSVGGGGGLVGGSSSDIIVEGTPALVLPAVSAGLNNFTVNRSGGITLGSNLTVNGVLTFTSGTVTLGNYSLNIGGTISGTPNITYNGSGSASNAGSTSQVSITAPTSGTLPPVVNSLTVNYSGTVSLPSNVTVNSLVVTTGSLDLNNHSLALSATPDLIFPGTGVVTALSATEATNPMMPTRIDRQWSISGGVTSTLRATFTWFAGDDANFPWGSYVPAVYQGASKLVTVSYGLRTITAEIASLSTKDLFTIGLDFANGDLPVELTSFTAVPATSELLVTLQWTTESETNNLGFNIIRSNTNFMSNGIYLNSDLILGTNTSGQHEYQFADQTVEAPNIYYYWLENIDFAGNSSYHGPVMVQVFEQGEPSTPPVIPSFTKLNKAYPNPFNPETNISFELVTPSFVDLTIYDIKGRKIQTLTSQVWNIGNHHLVWNGQDFNGNTVGSGVYFYRMTAGKYVSTQKVVLMK